MKSVACSIGCAIVLAMLVSPAALADGRYAGQAHMCKATMHISSFKSPDQVWWGHKTRSFGNYIPFNPPEYARMAPPAAVTAFPPVLFDQNKWALKKEATLILDEVVVYLQNNPGARITVVGHASESENDPMGLSEKRAEVVKKYLMERGISGERVQTLAQGKNQPQTNAGPQGFLNRRVVIDITDSGIQRQSMALPEVIVAPPVAEVVVMPPAPEESASIEPAVTEAPVAASAPTEAPAPMAVLAPAAETPGPVETPAAPVPAAEEATVDAPDPVASVSAGATDSAPRALVSGPLNLNQLEPSILPIGEG